MRLSSMTPIALAALLGGVLPHPASANPTSDSLAVPVSPATTRAPSPSQGLAVPATPNPTATPETRNTPEFSQRPSVPTLQSNPNDVIVRATRVSIVGASQELQEIARQTIATKEGGDTNQQQLQRDAATLLETGLFSTARASSQANRDGLDVTFAVEPSIVRSLQLNNARVLPADVANSFFSDSIGKPVSPAAIKQGLAQIERWYQDNGYVLARVTDAHPTRDGLIKVTVAEGAISNIDIRFLDDKGQPTDGRTQQDYIRKGLKLQPGDIFRIDTAREDLRQLYQLGLFKNANIKLDDAANQQVNVAYLLTESPSRGFDAGGGYSDSAGLFGSIRYNDQNFGGVNNQLNVNATVGTRDVQFNANYGKPYRASRPDEMGYNINAFRGSGTSTALEDSTLANGDTPRERRIGAGVTVTKPIDDWNASVGLNYTRTSIRDGNGKVTPVDANGKPLSLSDSGIDDLVTVRAAVGQDRRDNPANPTSGSVVNFSTEQSLPIGSGSILMNRLEAKYSQYVPLSIFQGKNPEVLAFNVQGGTTIGDLPPYQAFTLGGANSVRGYGNGDLATSRSYVLATAEYRVPLFDSPVSGVLFADFGSDLGSSSSVPGEPGASKPGTGFGYGAGVRVNSPVGTIRADYGISDRGDSRVQFGLGQRF
ncbi:BamA/TamA family outer membrane protein [Oscillatoria sp. FACHB-1406]|uniref:BamA/TamA family outer membrane protein n=1 Tax=Oscillatoria sp. FACHB-1406 TaxID=2692846 RepID=UPI001684D9EF|nr:BamA/TamA family outer membrane protein [Oscillatoria sp. FACHB-1406]MBD2578846.1 BamA/TamA family outer membrane protein [Oscillatoria sp. FACHB-1406]